MKKRDLSRDYAQQDFSCFPEIEKSDSSEYPGLMFYVNRVLQPEKRFLEGVSDIFISLFNNTDGCFCSTEKYDRSQREYTKAQVRKFSDSIKTLECVFGPNEEFGIGNLGRGKIVKGDPKIKQFYHPVGHGRYTDLLSSEYFIGEEKLDLIVLYKPELIVPSELELEVYKEILLDGRLGEEFEEGFKEIQKKYLEGFSEDEFKRMDTELEPINSILEEGVEGSVAILEPKVREYIERNDGLSFYAKQALEAVIETKKLKEKLLFKANEIIATWPNLERIVQGFSKRLNQNGILIVDSSQVYSVVGLTTVARYGDVGIYHNLVA